ncbi:MAG: MDR family oxidoreductase [Thermodesulfobacteriota bacterium]|jgi:putative YhdH/YhfP family quinone oxidoreductase
MSETFKAIVAEEVDGKVRASLKDLTANDLPPGDVTVRVAYSTLNYKDGLAVTGRAKIARRFPMVCGIDLAGTVEESQNPEYKPGDRVLITGWGLSETHWGGYSQKQRVKAEWLIPVPEPLSLKQAMAIGTAGFTSMLCVMALEHLGVAPGAQPVIVTGAAGGVGGVAVALLARLGYAVAASTGRPELRDYLTSLGATDIVERATLAQPSGRPLDPERWAGGVDTVGGEVLASVLRGTRYGGAVAACGLAGGATLPTTVYPFILRGVSLLGIDSVMCPKPKRVTAWQRLVRDLPLDKLDTMTVVEPMTKVPVLAEEILKGRVRGRVVIDVNA